MNGAARLPPSLLLSLRASAPFVSLRLRSAPPSPAWLRQRAARARARARSGGGCRAPRSGGCWSCWPTGWWRWAPAPRCCCASCPCPTAATRRRASAARCPPGPPGRCRSCPRCSSPSPWPPAGPPPAAGPTACCWAASCCTTCTGTPRGSGRGGQSRAALSLAWLYRSGASNCLGCNSSSLPVRYRALVFPFLIRQGKPTPFFTFLLALLFCVYNGYLQGRSLSNYAEYPSGWLKDPRFVAGFIGWLVGMAINIHSDHILRNLRKPGETGYKIPRGGMFEYVSGANFFGEILEWFGFALACCTIESLAFALCTLFILGSRAKQHHQWYLEKFEDYPKDRKILIPFVY
uniref:3-oxo-5alpha-steroid 4-dehydrogenase (NADP(+)) n=1 Tax=Cairina moschata TaxID=8855 RepID=A0A8C3BUR9_CAIMO